MLYVLANDWENDTTNYGDYQDLAVKIKLITDTTGVCVLHKDEYLK